MRIEKDSHPPKRKIFFRADADPTIGYGHFIRSLALADMLKDDFDCVFYTQSPTDYQQKEAASVCHLEELPADDTRFELFLNELTGTEIVVLDNYFYTTDYQRKIKEKGCKLVCIDDMHDKHYVADAVVNHGPVRPEEFDCEPYTRLCVGAKWSLLRKPFLVPVKSCERKKQIVVCLGGADPQRLTDKIVSYLFDLGVQYEVVVVLGDSAYLSETNRKRVTVKHNLSALSMAELFETASIGVLPSSSVRMEAVSRGLKVICGYFVDNQQIGYERSLKQKDIIPIYGFSGLTIEKLELALNFAKSFTFRTPDYSQVPSNYINLMLSL